MAGASLGGGAAGRNLATWSLMATEAPAVPWDHPAVAALVADARQRRTVCVGDLDALARDASLTPEQLCEIQRVLRDEGLEIDDDCGKEHVPVTRYRPQQLAEYTGDGLQQFLNEAGREPLLTPDEEKELARRIERGDLAAKDRMIRANLRLVVSIARRYQGRPIAGILLMTDGSATDAASLTRLIERAGTTKVPPIYPVLLGGERAADDVSVGRVAVTQTSF